MIPRSNTLGVGITALNLESAVEAFADALGQRRKGYVCVTGVHGVSEAQTDPEFRRILNNAFLCTPDGMPTVWVGRWQGFKEMDRVYGPDLMLDVFKRSEETGWKHFFYGGANGAGEELKAKLAGRFPKVAVVGVFEPPFRPLNDAEQEPIR